ncbi:MAG: hypothetical protein ABWY27_05900 [Telluria sp.]
MKLRQSAADENNGQLEELISKQMASVASGRGMAPTGNVINVKA